MRYHRQLMNAILSGRAQIAKAVNATVVDLEDAPYGYAHFDRGVARKFVIDPHGLVPSSIQNDSCRSRRSDETEAIQMENEPSLLRRSVAELIGTTMLVWIGAGTAAFNSVLANQNHHPVTLADMGLDVLGLSAYFSWPGFFEVVAWVEHVAGSRDLMPVLRIWPLAVDLLALVPFGMILMRLRASWRAKWFAAFAFAVGNWVGQDYFSPQLVVFTRSTC